MESQKQIQIYNNAEFGEIRSMEIGGEPWFVGKEVTTFRYNEKGKARIRELAREQKTA
jgi:prophage antirepressor-like protein